MIGLTFIQIYYFWCNFWRKYSWTVYSYLLLIKEWAVGGHLQQGKQCSILIFHLNTDTKNYYGFKLSSFQRTKQSKSSRVQQI